MPCSSTPLTLAGTLMGKRWRRQEVRAWGGKRKGEKRCVSYSVLNWGILCSLSSLRAVVLAL